MSEYNFHNFDDYDFELLCCDLLNEDQRINTRTKHGLEYKQVLSFNTFKRGKDKGVDLYFENEGYTVIGQVKLFRGKFNELYNSLKQKKGGRNEYDKVIELRPSKYIFMTSTPLSLSNKEDLKKFFSPFIISTKDIYGKEDLNRLIRQFDRIEKMYVKLYLNNTVVLENILNKATLDRSNFTREQILSKIELFVQTSNFSKALEILDTKNLLIIKGIPGVGKTTLAKILSLYYIKKGYRFIEIFDLDNEIERLIDADDEKCIFYYDDFLGSNSLLISDALRNENRLNSIIRRIALKSNKALIMTTRTNILNNAQYNSEKLKRVFDLISTFEIDITHLNQNEKKEILYRHIKRNCIEKLFDINSRLFDEIINHQNYSPRLIEFITDKRNTEKYSTNYRDFAIESHNNPEQIWSYTYNQQIDHIDKIYINHLFLFGKSCNIIRFKESFINRLKYEVSVNNYTITNNEFKKCTTTLDGTFITIKSRYNYNDYINQQEVEFLNPSIADFLFKEIRSNIEAIKGSISSFDDIEILLNRFNHNRKDLDKLYSTNQLKEILLSNVSFDKLNKIHDKIKYLEIILNYFPLQMIEEQFSNEIINIIDESSLDNYVEDFCDLMFSLRELKIVHSYISKKKRELIKILFTDTFYINEFEAILTLCITYNIDIKLQIKDNEINELFIEVVNRVIDEEIEQFVYERKDNIQSIEKVNIISQQALNHIKPTFDMFENVNDLIVQKLYNYNWDHLLRYNKYRNGEEIILY